MDGDIPEEQAINFSCDSDDGFKEPYYDFGPDDLSNTRRRVGFQETPRGRRRPKSACSAGGRRDRLKGLTRGEPSRPTRCNSALGLRRGGRGEMVLSPSSDDLPPDNTCIRSFRRSLKLLGLQLEGFDLNAAEPSPKPDIKNAKSKVNSLVTRRTVSLEDLHEAVVTVGFPLANTESWKQRKVLAKAVYEEWYFKKQEEEMRRKLEARRQQKVQQWETQHRRYEQMRKSNESYSEWLHKKKKQQQKEQLRKAPTKPTVLGGKPSELSCQEAYESWKKEKEKCIKKKLEEARIKQKLLEDSTKREDSERAYQEWKKNADKEWSLKIKNRERKLREMQQEEEVKRLDKQKHAEMAYKGWLETKEEELKMKIKEARQAQAAAMKRMTSRRSDRLYESQQAFLTWLDLVEERFCKQLMEKRKTKKQLSED